MVVYLYQLLGMKYQYVPVNVNPGWPKEFGWRKGLSVRIPTLPLAFTVSISSQNIYISTICNVRMMLRRIAVVRVPLYGHTTPLICLGTRFTLIGALFSYPLSASQSWNLIFFVTQPFHDLSMGCEH